MRTENSKSLILNDIKSSYNYKTDAEFAKFLGVPPTTLSSWHKRNSFDYDLLYSKCVGLNPEFLFTGQGSVKKDPIDATTNNDFSLKTDSRTELQRVPLYGMEAAASLVKLFDGSPSIVDYISIPNLPKSDGALYITGDSMYPLLKSGDIAVYKQVHNIPDGIFYGEMYLLDVDIDGDEHTVVKFVQKSERGPEWITLVSQNSHHASKEVHLKGVRAMALVKASIRINSMV